MTKPTINVTPAAAKAFKDAREADGDALHLEVSPSFQHDLFFGTASDADVSVDAGGITILLGPESVVRAHGLTIDYVIGPGGEGFRIDNPNAPASVEQLSPEALKAMLDSGAPPTLLDVRGDAERAIATIPSALPLGVGAEALLASLDKSAPLVFHCHHGGRSQAAAEHAVRAGFRKVYNLRGGIDAWSLTVDPSVPRY